MFSDIATTIQNVLMVVSLTSILLIFLCLAALGCCSILITACRKMPRSCLFVLFPLFLISVIYAQKQQGGLSLSNATGGGCASALASDDQAESDGGNESSLRFVSILTSDESITINVEWDESLRFVSNSIYIGATTNLVSGEWEIVREVDVSGCRSNAQVILSRSDFPLFFSAHQAFFAAAAEIDSSDAMADQDMDGIPDVDERMWGTDPGNADTDGDGLRDGDELVFGTDPTNSDTDNDGILDGIEASLGTNAVFEPSPGPIPTGPLFEYIGTNVYTTTVVSNSTRMAFATDVSAAGLAGIEFEESGMMPVYYRKGVGLSMRVLQTGRYTFKLHDADDVVNVRINDITITGDYYGDKPAASTILEAGQVYPISVEVWNRGGPAKLTFEKWAEFSPVQRIAMESAFTKDKVIFEKPLDLKPGGVIARKTTYSTLRIAAIGGYYGGILSLRRIDGDRLCPSGVNFNPNGEVIPLGESVQVFSIPVGGMKASFNQDDAEIEVKLEEFVSGETLVQTARLTTVCMTITAEAPFPVNKNRRRIGVGERMAIEFDPNISTLSLSTQDPTSSVGADVIGNITYTAPDHGCEDRLSEATCGELANFSIVEPTGYKANVTAYSVSATPGVAGSFRVDYELVLEPSDVSLAKVELMEVGMTSTDATGYFSRARNAHFLTHTGGNVNKWVQVGDHNESTDIAICAQLDPPWEDGSAMTWPIPNRWRVSGSSSSHYLGNTDQRFTIDSNGYVTMEKFGWRAECATNRLGTVQRGL